MVPSSGAACRGCETVIWFTEYRMRDHRFMNRAELSVEGVRRFVPRFGEPAHIGEPSPLRVSRNCFNERPAETVASCFRPYEEIADVEPARGRGGLIPGHHESIAHGPAGFVTGTRRCGRIGTSPLLA